jgi:hypothetical protein
MFSLTEAILSAYCSACDRGLEFWKNSSKRKHYGSCLSIQLPMIYYCLVYALLPPIQYAAYGSSNVEVSELRTRCFVSHLHQITNQTSTTPNVIRSFEYGYTMGRLNEQWEILHQQGVQKNDNAMHLLLSSQTYFQIRKMDILFITFLPL